MSSRSIRLVEVGGFDVRPTVAIIGLPDVGLVGSISTSYLATHLKAKEIGYFASDLLPAVMVLHDGVPKEATRVYASPEAYILVAETPLPPAITASIIKSMIGWFSVRGVKEVYSLGGIVADNRFEIDKPETFIATSSKAKWESVRTAGLNTMDEGVIIGPFALVMRESIKLNLTSTVILSQSFPDIPDPEAASSALESLSKIGGPRVDVSALKQMGNEIKLRTKELAQKVKAYSQESEKTYDLPLMYG
ncbi:MAG: PAC2 family protein [Thermoprotei archaeon]